MGQRWTHVSVPPAVSCVIAYMMPTGVIEKRGHQNTVRQPIKT